MVKHSPPLQPMLGKRTARLEATATTARLGSESLSPCPSPAFLRVSPCEVRSVPCWWECRLLWCCRTPGVSQSAFRLRFRPQYDMPSIRTASSTPVGACAVQQKHVCMRTLRINGRWWCAKRRGSAGGGRGGCRDGSQGGRRHAWAAGRDRHLGTWRGSCVLMRTACVEVSLLCWGCLHSLLLRGGRRRTSTPTCLVWLIRGPEYCTTQPVGGNQCADVPPVVGVVRRAPLFGCCVPVVSAGSAWSCFVPALPVCMCTFPAC